MTSNTSFLDNPINPHSAAPSIATPAGTHQLTIHCTGRIELPEDDPVFGTYWRAYGYVVGVCRTLAEAVHVAENRIAHPPENLLRAAEALSFSPRIVTIKDAAGCLALGGRLFSERILWCAPVTTDEEALHVRTESENLRLQAGFEAGWDNYSSAERLREEAELLATHAVDSPWRLEALELTKARETTGVPILAIRLKR